MTTEIIKPEEIEEYINHVWHEIGEPMTRMGNIDLLRLKHRLNTSTYSTRELQAFMEWRKHVQLSNSNV